MSRILIVGSNRTTSSFLSILVDQSVARTVDPSTAPDSLAQDGVELVIDLSSDDARAIRPVAYPDGAVVFASVLETTATALTASLGRPILGISYLPGLGDRSAVIEVSAPLGSGPDLIDRGAALLRETTGREVEIVEDRVGLVSARVLSMVINEAAFALMESVADPAGIDTAMKLGTNYPLGPLAWADAIGAERIVAILEALQREYGEERYRPAVLLKQHARARLAFHMTMTD